MFTKGNQLAKGKGRPKGSSYIQICQQWAEKEGWQLLIDTARGKKYPGESKPAIAAAQILIAYGYGKPKETVDVNLGGDIGERLQRAIDRTNAV